MKASIFTRASGVRWALTGLLLALAVALPASPALAAAGPAWSLTATSYPTNFAPGASSAANGSGPAYLISAVNIGGGSTSGSFTITDSLPAALKPSASIKPSGIYGRPKFPETFKCTVVGRRITCTGTDPGVGPGQHLQVRVPVDVESSAPAHIVNKVKIEGGGAAPVSTTATTTISSETAPFGFVDGPAGLFGVAANADGSPSTQAGSHPSEMIAAGANFPVVQEEGNGANPAAGGGIRDVIAELPPGLVVNPLATPVRCKEAQLITEGVGCPDASQVGSMGISLSGIGSGLNSTLLPLYNMLPPAGVAAELAFEVVPGTYGHVLGSVRSDGTFQLTAKSNDIVAKVTVAGIAPMLWGVPSSEIHDAERGICAYYNGTPVADKPLCPVERTNVPFLTQPSSCGGPLTTTARITGWVEPGNVIEKSVESTDFEGNPIGISGCNRLEFAPTISAQPTTNLADSPSGLDFDLHVPQAPVVEQQAGRAEFCTTGAWGGDPTSYAFQWLRNGIPIPSANSSTYVTQETDAASSLQCEVVATSKGGQTRVASAPLVILPAPPSAAPTPATPQLTITPAGEAVEEMATCDPGAWGGNPTFIYRWFKDGVLVPGETADTFTAPGPPPFSLQCEVMGSNDGGAVVAFSAISAGSLFPVSLVPPQVNLPEEEVPLATANLKETRVTLPAGMALNPAAGGGLAACDSTAIGLTTPVGQAVPIRFREVPQRCPDAAKIGSVEVETPLLDHPLPGAVYLAKPFDNPFGSLMAIYLAVEDPESGTIAKLAGEVKADATTGQLSTTFRESPQLPLEDVRLHLFEGARAPLTTPLACGTYATTSVLTPWSTPEGADVTASDRFATVAAPKGGSCPSGEANAPNAPVFTAGTVSPQAGAYSPFVLRLTRPDGSQRLTAIDTTLPKGLTGKLAGIPYCSEAQIAQAQSRSKPNEGSLEQASPSCPATSEVGPVDVGAGSGISPLFVRGHAYMAGPYKGAPLSLVIVTPAVAGPFDLGTVVVRTALRVDPETAQIRAVSDPLPTILYGIPLDVRSIAVKMDRPAFTLNPTSCDPMAITGAAITAAGQSAALNSPFQVGGCSALPFKPKLSISLKGGTKRGDHPALTAVATAKPGEANIATVSVALPHSAFLDQAHIKTICTRVQFAAGAVPGEGCPKASIYGKASATTPLLAEPVSGPVYLRSSSHPLPDLVVALHGQVDVVVAGRVDSIRGGIRNSFEAVPDAPVTKFTLQMQGGKKGLIVNSRDICKSVQRATVLMEGQNGKTNDLKPLIKNSCKHKGKKKHGQRKKRH